jgi:hypothetical protein
VPLTLLALAAAVVCWFHLSRGLALAGPPGAQNGPAGRVRLVYVYVTCTIAILTGLFAAVAAVYSMFGLAGPGIFSSGSRTSSVRSLITATVALAGSLRIVVTHWRWGGEQRSEVAPTPTELPPPTDTPPPAGDLPPPTDPPPSRDPVPATDPPPAIDRPPPGDPAPRATKKASPRARRSASEAKS